jgi:hypothetical protein
MLCPHNFYQTVLVWYKKKKNFPIMKVMARD